MDISRRLIGASAILSPERKVVDVDIDGLIRRLLLFDKYVLVSVRLQEFPLLARHLGYEGLRDLLASRLIEIRCECLQLGQTAQAGLHGDPKLPLFSYKFSWLDAADRSKYISDCLEDWTAVPSLQYKQVSKLKRAIDGAIRQLPAQEMRSSLYPGVQSELLHNPRLVKAAVAMVLRQRFKVSDVPFSLTVRQEADDVFVVETDVHQNAGISEVEGHQAVETGILGISGMTQSIGEMKFYSAISGFRDEELPLFRQKLDFMASGLSSEAKEANFRRVINIGGLPQFSSGAGTLDVEKLLKIRESSEVREFRDWLVEVGDATDAQIADRIAGFRARAGLAISGNPGRAMRFLVTSAAGLALPVVGAALVSSLDQFILDKILPRSGIAAFVNELYPSIFKSD